MLDSISHRMELAVRSISVHRVAMYTRACSIKLSPPTPDPCPSLILRGNHSYGRWCHSCRPCLLLRFGLVSSFGAMESNGTCLVCNFPTREIHTAHRIQSTQTSPGEVAPTSVSWIRILTSAVDTMKFLWIISIPLRGRLVWPSSNIKPPCRRRELSL